MRLLAMRIVLLGLSVFLVGGVIWTCSRAPILPGDGSLVQKWYRSLEVKSARVSLPGAVYWISKTGDHLELDDGTSARDRPHISIPAGAYSDSKGLVCNFLRKRWWSLGVFPSSDWPHDRTNEARALALDQYAHRGVPPEVIKELRVRNRVTRWSISVPLLLFEITWLMALLLWPISLVRVINARCARRRDRCLARGECPVCRYDISGIDATLCPECGEAWLADELTGTD